LFLPKKSEGNAKEKLYPVQRNAYFHITEVTRESGATSFRSRNGDSFKSRAKPGSSWFQRESAADLAPKEQP
jgi:hypothetical protein